MVIYVCKCGCEIPKSKISKITRGQHRSQRYVCREHKEVVLYRKKQCMDCGELFKIHDKGPGAWRCDDCEAIEAEERLKRRPVHKSVKPPPVPGAKWSEDPRGDYCTHLMECMSGEGLDCGECPKFSGIYFGFDPAKAIGC